MKEEGVLVFNVGSSSIKYKLFSGEKLLESGKYERLKTGKDYEKSIKEIFKKIEPEKISLIIHRVVHGGELNHPEKINNKIKNEIKKFSEFAPLHNPNQLRVIELCEKYKKEQYAVFDTMFFSEIPEKTKIYSIPKAISKKFKIRRYGFHGLSHEFVSKNLKGKTIVCHLGSGTSISAIIDGKPIDTSMGFTPLEGLMMGTRSGTIDPGIILFLQKEGYDVEEMLTKKSGLKGISGYNDFRDIRTKLSKDKNCKLAYEMFEYQIIKKIGSYISAMRGINNLIFTGAIGENVPKVRKEICESLKYIRAKIDNKKNQKNSEIISSKNSKIKILVRQTDEEKMALEKVLEILR
jgi:acetate kinase